MTGRVERIWKYKCPAPGMSEDIEMPRGGRLVHVDGFEFWVAFPEINIENREVRTFYTLATGKSYNTDWMHRGTWVDRPFVWHLMEKVNDW